jgi:hypothetical protein
MGKGVCVCVYNIYIYIYMATHVEPGEQPAAMALGNSASTLNAEQSVAAGQSSYCACTTDSEVPGGRREGGKKGRKRDIKEGKGDRRTEKEGR